MKILPVAALLVLHVVGVDGYVFMDDIVQCSNDGAVCAYYSGFGPDPAEICNETGDCTTEYLGEYGIGITIVSGLNEGDNREDCSGKRICAIGEIKVSWKKNNVCSQVDTTVGACASCETCGLTGEPGTEGFTAAFSADW
jgi:hypothetical protein